MDSSYETIKNDILFSLIGAAILCLISVCAICGYMRTHKHVYQGAERKQRSEDDLLPDRDQDVLESPVEHDIDNESAYYRTKTAVKSNKRVESESLYYTPQLRNSNADLHRTQSEGGASLRDKYLIQNKS